MTVDLLAAARPIIHKLELIARDDPRFRNDLRMFAEALLDFTVDPSASGEERRSLASARAALGGDWMRSDTRATPTEADVSTTATAELELMQRRFSLKAEAARWAAERRRRLEQSVDFEAQIKPYDRELIDRAGRLPDCYLWMCRPDSPQPDDPTRYDELGGCFAVAAHGVGMLRELLTRDEAATPLLEQVLLASAEAQSSLRVAIADMGAAPDPDQLRLFDWLRAITGERRIFVPRYMRSNDRADPHGWAELQSRLEELAAQVDHSRGESESRSEVFRQLQQHIQAAQDSEDEEAQYHWERVISGITELVDESGIPANHSEFQSLLAPVVDHMPILPLTESAQRVLNEIDHHLAVTPAEDNPAAVVAPEVGQLAAGLQGCHMVIVGGEQRPQDARVLSQEFSLGELVWVNGRDHDDPEGFADTISQSEVALVLMAPLWANHSFDEVKALCDQHGKPLVRLAGSYDPSQVAKRILEQAGEWLKSESYLNQ